MGGRTTAESVLRAFEQRGWDARFVPGERRVDLWRELEERLKRAELDRSFFEECIRPLERPIREAPEWVRSILIVAVPDPAMRIRFEWRGREVAVTIPPTYVHWRERADDEVERVLRAALGGAGYHVSPANVPKKLLATRSGLAAYGRNNITYVKGMGSICRMVALYTGIPCTEDPWREPEMMPACRSCRACLENCPTGAITEERFLLRAERCLTYWNEKAADVPFPGWIDSSSHNQLVGCMRCQTVCPMNSGHLTVEEAGPPFTEEETAAFLRGAPVDGLAEETLDKLRQHDILEYLELLPRNLGALL